MHGRRTWFALLLILAGAVLWIGGSALAQTPHSVQKSCGYQGGPSCPKSPPTEGPWQYELSPANTAPDSEFHSFSDISNWISDVWAPAAGVCSATVTSETEDDNGTGYPEYAWDIVEADYYVFPTHIIAYSQYGQPSPPWCATQWNQNFQVWITRQVACPARMTGTYSSSPLTGPYCSLPSGTPLFQKQMGQSCPNCAIGSSNQGGADSSTGSTVAGDSVNVSNGNNYQAETDYVGTGQNPLKFTRSYNSLTAYTAWGWSGVPVPSMYIGSAWMATYFQRLVPVSVTDSTTTYNAVHAYRPDGRVLIFSEYNGVYSPDGDVSDSLVQTSTGWQYQTADDTIETYDTSGQLLSVAARGRAPVTVNFTADGEPPTSVSDAFGHTLQFSYGLDSTKVERLMSVTDEAGATIQYAYDSYGNFASVTYQDGTQRQYSYGQYSNHALQTLTDEAGVAYATWNYGSSYGASVASSQLAGGVAAYSYSSSLSGAGGSVSVTDPVGKTRTYNGACTA